MLKRRVITAVLLLAILLPALFYWRPEPFYAIALGLVAAAGWEWGRMNRCGQAPSLVIAALVAALCGASWLAGWTHQALLWLWLSAGAGWVLAVVLLLTRGVAGWGLIPKPVRLLAGIAALWLAWLAMAQARVLGIEFLLSVLVLVWTADIAAYASGKTWGGRFSRQKLAPAISPGKTWEGVWGGIAGVVLLALVWSFIDGRLVSEGGSLYRRLADAHGTPLMLLAAVCLAAMSVCGDLVESLIKRSAGVKDSSALLPGHGGVLDRIDGLLPTLPLALMLVSL